MKERDSTKERNDKIRDVYKSRDDWKLKELAKMFNVSIATIHFAIHGRKSKKKPGEE
jgi:DeoR/GlpR family transcriptional regulator of sugar metabolism